MPHNDLPLHERIAHYRQRAAQKASDACSLPQDESLYELLIAKAWQDLADYLEASIRSKSS